jgi:hypothetical protein
VERRLLKFVQRRRWRRVLAAVQLCRCLCDHWKTVHAEAVQRKATAVGHMQARRRP